MHQVHPVYVVDDDRGVRALLGDLCEDRGIVCRGFANGEDFLDALGELQPGCVLLDMRLPRRSGLQVQAEMARRGHAFPVVAITGYGGVDIAVESMRLGAVDFIEKPFVTEILFEALERGFGRLSDTGGTATVPA